MSARVCGFFMTKYQQKPCSIPSDYFDGCLPPWPNLPTATRCVAQQEGETLLSAIPEAPGRRNVPFRKGFCILVDGDLEAQ